MVIQTKSILFRITPTILSASDLKVISNADTLPKSRWRQCGESARQWGELDSTETDTEAKDIMQEEQERQIFYLRKEDRRRDFAEEERVARNF